MKRKPAQVVELEAELLRLTELVRARRTQLNRLDKCPNKDCECREVWREVTEKKLDTQVKKVRTGVLPRPALAKTKAVSKSPKTRRS